MADGKTSETCRESLSEPFGALIEKAISLGWPEHEVALALTELAEAYVVKVSARIIIEGSLQSQRVSERLKN
ncbi:hypothetical protein ATY81_18255 [Rhizobium sp. R72]|uniref:hypothetical protein n=1 Tax=unclassified Rhizobium TaxID=2613769 RepID=UPI000B532290|nr:MULTISPECIES: hypothetical protein [unclassified Rhizobium]OWV98421.1 hypothetical protein ATY79_19995 [Rhizobium sp. R693]OWW03656.1 hypothetical protein ATY81_18255 [Rhizobium sp. R72]OWW03863.1 hypothetical protein ATY80_18255 [Rhizobium sp. R711]